MLIVSKLFSDNILLPSNVPLIDSKGCVNCYASPARIQRKSSAHLLHFGELFGVLIVSKLFSDNILLYLIPKGWEARLYGYVMALLCKCDGDVDGKLYGFA